MSSEIPKRNKPWSARIRSRNADRVRRIHSEILSPIETFDLEIKTARQDLQSPDNALPLSGIQSITNHDLRSPMIDQSVSEQGSSDPKSDKKQELIKKVKEWELTQKGEALRDSLAKLEKRKELEEKLLDSAQDLTELQEEVGMKPITVAVSDSSPDFTLPTFNEDDSESETHPMDTTQWAETSLGIEAEVLSLDEIRSKLADFFKAKIELTRTHEPISDYDFLKPFSDNYLKVQRLLNRIDNEKDKKYQFSRFLSLFLTKITKYVSETEKSKLNDDDVSEIRNLHASLQDLIDQEAAGSPNDQQPQV